MGRGALVTLYALLEAAADRQGLFNNDTVASVVVVAGTFIAH